MCWFVLFSLFQVGIKIILAINLIFGGGYHLMRVPHPLKKNVYDLYHIYDFIIIFLNNRYVVREGLRGTSRECSSDARLARGQPGQ
jgi:hypothetical protein